MTLQRRSPDEEPDLQQNGMNRTDMVADMVIPDLIPVARVPGHRTDTIGRYDHGLFFGYVTGASREGLKDDLDWRNHKPWYAVLHRFDHAGAHVESKIWSPGPGNRDGLAGLLATWLDELLGREYCDIAIQPFEVTYDGIRFALALESHGEYAEGAEQLDWAELYPGRLGFSAPWNGSYDT